jgi:hypothetical protein
MADHHHQQQQQQQVQQQQLLAAYYQSFNASRAADPVPVTEPHFQQQQQQQQQQLLLQLQALQQQMLPFQQHQWNENMFQHMVQGQPQQQFQQPSLMQEVPTQQHPQHVEAHLQPPYHMHATSQQQQAQPPTVFGMGSAVANRGPAEEEAEYYLPGPTIPGLFIHPAMHPQQQAMPPMQGFSLNPPLTALLQPFVHSAPATPLKAVHSASSSGAGFESSRAEGAPGERSSSPDEPHDEDEEVEREGADAAGSPGGRGGAVRSSVDQHTACREAAALLQSTIASLREELQQQGSTAQAALEKAKAAQATVERKLETATKSIGQLREEMKTAIESHERVQRQLADEQREGKRKRENLQTALQDLRKQLASAQGGLATSQREALAQKAHVESLQDSIAALEARLKAVQSEAEQAAEQAAAEVSRLKEELQKPKAVEQHRTDVSSAAAPTIAEADEQRGRKQKRKEARRLHMLRQEDDDLDQIVAEVTGAAATQAATNPCDGVDDSDRNFAAIGMPRNLVAVLRSNVSSSGSAASHQDPPKDDSVPCPLSYRQRTEVLRRGLFCLFAVQREATLAWQMHCARLQCRISHLNKQNTRLLETCTRLLPRNCFSLVEDDDEPEGEQTEDTTADMLQQLMESTEPELPLLDRALYRYSGPVALLYELHQRSEERVAHFRAQLRDAEVLHRTDQSTALIALKTLWEAALINPASLDAPSRTAITEALAQVDKLPSSCNTRWLESDLQPNQGSFRPQLTAVAVRSADKKREAAATRKAREELARTIDRKIQHECTTEKLSTILGAHLSLRHSADLDAANEAEGEEEEEDDNDATPSQQVPP